MFTEPPLDFMEVSVRINWRDQEFENASKLKSSVTIIIDGFQIYISIEFYS